MKKRILNTKELSQYIGINEKKIYMLITEKGLPATKVTGKWIFLKDMVDAWLEESLGKKKGGLISEDVLLITGSDDILFTQLTEQMKQNIPAIFPFLCKTGSLNGLNVLKNGNANMAGTHLFDEQTKEYNLPFIEIHLKDQHVVSVNFAERKQGIIVKKGNPKGVQKLEDLAKGNICIVNRQEGSGTRRLLDNHLMKLGILNKLIQGYENEVQTHLDVGLSVLHGRADCGIGIEAVARMLGLEFIPLSKERYDLVIMKELFFSKPLQTLLEIVRSKQFRSLAKNLGGYDTKSSGKILFSS